MGGDFYDFLQLSSGEWVGVLADVSGKGMSAALLSSMVLGALSMEFRSGTQPQEVLNRVNQLLCEKSLPFQFVTLFLFLLSPHGVGQFISAGHNPAYLFRSATGKIEELVLRADALSWGCSIPSLINPARSISTKETFWWFIPTALRTRKTSRKKCSERKDC